MRQKTLEPLYPNKNGLKSLFSSKIEKTKQGKKDKKGKHHVRSGSPRLPKISLELKRIRPAIAPTRKSRNILFPKK